MSNADGDFDIYVVVPDSGVRRKLTDAPGQDGQPVWSPDCGADGSDLERLTSDPDGDERQPWWSPDGTRIVYARYVWFPQEPFY